MFCLFLVHLLTFASYFRCWFLRKLSVCAKAPNPPKSVLSGKDFKEGNRNQKIIKCSGSSRFLVKRQEGRI
jgi:hypothetical protein